LTNRNDESEHLAEPKEKKFFLVDRIASLAFIVRAFRHRNYRLFFSGQIISLLGSWVTQIATVWLTWELTHSALMLGVVGFAGQVPAFLLSPVAGVYVDRLPRHRLLIATQTLAMVQSFVLAILALTGFINIGSIIVLMICQGFINAFDMPARQAFVVEIVEDQEDLGNAIALNSSMFNVSRAIGTAVGGVILALFGAGWCFLLDGVSYIAVLISLMMMVVPPFLKKEHENPWLQLKEGFQYTIGFAPIRALLLLVAGMSLIGFPYSVLMPVIATKVLHGAEGTYATLATFFALGALTGALVLAARKSVRGLGRLIPYCTMSFGVALIIFSHSFYLWLSLGALFIMGFAMMTQNASSNTILQTIVDPEKRGRVMSFYVMAFMGMMPLGSLWGGAVADRIGAQNTLLICGIGCLGLAGWFTRGLPKLAEHIRPIYQEMGIIPEVARGIDNTAELTRPPERMS
jgi:MFS family permease